MITIRWRWLLRLMGFHIAAEANYPQVRMHWRRWLSTVGERLVGR